MPPLSPSPLRALGARERAFTLIELLLTTLLITLLATAVVVNVEGVVPGFRLEGAAREIGATAAEVQSTAAVTGRMHGIVYDLAAGEYWILAPPEKTEGEETLEAARSKEEEEEQGEEASLVALPPFRLHKSIHIKDISLGGKKTRTRGQVKILFDADGAGSPHSVHLASDEDKEYTIEVNPFAGTVEFFEGRREFDAFLEGEEGP